MTDPLFFGYGSLVNRRTHDYPDATPARIEGWQRAWRRSPLRAVCFLTVVPAPGAYVEGLAARVPGGDWAALDRRERAYERRTAQDTGPLGPREITVYAIAEGRHFDPTDDNPILLSYLDVVVQGYLAEFGAGGVAHFFDSTRGWQAPVLDDRAAPVYGRAQALAASERDLVDLHLDRLKVRRVRM